MVGETGRTHPKLPNKHPAHPPPIEREPHHTVTLEQNKAPVFSREQQRQAEGEE